MPQRAPTLVAVEKEAAYRRRLGRVIVELRVLRGFSQEELAGQIDRSTAAVSRWETGKVTPTAWDMRRICEVLDAPADLLLFPPDLPVSPIAELLEARAAGATRKGLGGRGPAGGAK